MNTAKVIVTAIAALLIPMGAIADSTTMYDVDENHDGRADRMLILEQSDSLA